MSEKDGNTVPGSPHRPTRMKKWSDTDNNPCKMEAEESFQCLHVHNFNRQMCDDAFRNYRNCQTFWGRIQRNRRHQGIKPALPPEKERQEIIEKMQAESS